MAAARQLPTASGPRPPRARYRWRRTAGRLLLLAMVALVLRTWLVQGLFIPFHVVSGSMADTLRGPHREVICAECGHRFACASDLRAVSPRAVCPNCDCRENDLAGQPDVDGDRVLVDKLTYSLRPPRRWELVAFRHPREPSRILVKRVVGLPGESVRIRDGEVYVDGKLQRKSLLEQRALAVLVHDANHPPPSGLPPRWDDDLAGAGWGSADGRFAHPSIPGETSIHWLTYRHWRRTPGLTDPTQEAPIANYRGYNQTRPQRAENVHPVADVMLSFRLVRALGEGQLLVWATDGRDTFQVRMEPPQGGYEVRRNGRPVGRDGPRKMPPWKEGLHVEVSLVDRQFLLAFDGHPAVVYPYEPTGPPVKPPSGPLAVGSRGLGVELRDLRVYRDVYYTHPVGVKGRWALEEPFRLGPDEHFVLGDNSPVSEDSRTWPERPAVPRRVLIGKPFLTHFPARRLALGRWHIQVPDAGRIGYIR